MDLTTVVKSAAYQTAFNVYQLLNAYNAQVELLLTMFPLHLLTKLA